jgi:L-threonylcarbamoyladenylate synthase
MRKKMRHFRETEIEAMAAVLKNNGVLAVPTDTVYGVCARMDTQEAQARLRLVKHRPLTKAFPIMCCDEAQIRSVCLVDETNARLIRSFMPGPLTLILPKKSEVPAFVNGGLPTLAVRMATSEPLRQLIAAVGCPLFMTSANQSGQPTCTSLAQIEEACPDLDGLMEGRVTFGQASTIADTTGGEIKILRQGPLTLEQLQRAVQ